MSESLVLFIDRRRALAFLAVLKLGSSNSGSFSLSNFGINFFSKSTQTIRTGNILPKADETKKPDWVALATAAIGLLTALAGLFKR